MENRIYDEKIGLWYEKQEDYYLPCLELLEEDTQPIGIWGQRHARYLKQYRKVHYYNLLASGKLNSYLADIKQAENMFLWLVIHMAECENVTEQLKVENQMEWVAQINNICNRATEIVKSELINI